MDIIPNQLPRIHPLSVKWGNVASIDMLRLDEVHPVVSGNKWYKLKENIKEAHEKSCKGILTFGGAYSNHLVATAMAANTNSLQSVGIIRGKYAQEKLTKTLSDCIAYGMKLVFVDKEVYQLKAKQSYLDELHSQYPDFLIIPEGGANDMGRKGVSDLAQQIPDSYTHICVSAGTGTTFAGIINGVTPQQQVFGYAPMKGGAYLAKDITQWVLRDNWQLFDEWHFGGFGKCKQELLDFMNEFYGDNDIPLDMVYTAKMMFGLKAQILDGVFRKEAKILAVHTGGLQGNVSVASKLIY